MSDTPRPRRRRRLARWAAVALLIATLYLTRGWTLPAWGRWLDASEPPRAADYALVLTGGEETRPFVAAGLYNRGFVKEVLVPRMRLIPDAAEGIDPPESDQIRDVLVRRGVPADRITLLPGEVNSTTDEAAALARFLDDHPGGRWRS